MVPISHLSQFKQKLGMFGGKIWIDTYGACSYECALCQKTFFSAGSFEYHVSHDHRNQFTRSNQTVTNTVHPNQVVLDKSHNKNPTGFNVDRPLHVKSTIEIIDSGAKQAVHVKSHNEPSGYDVNRSLRVNSNNGTTNYGAKQARPVKFYNETNTKYGERQRKNNDELICKKCNKTFDTLERVRTHTRDYHQYQCTYCPTDTVKGFETEKGKRYFSVSCMCSHTVLYNCQNQQHTFLSEININSYFYLRFMVTSTKLSSENISIQLCCVSTRIQTSR